MCVCACVFFCCLEALAYECLPSRSPALNFLRTTDGIIPGGSGAKKIVLIGIPKPMTKLPLCIADPMRMESCLLVLAELGDSTSEYLVCPGANKDYPERLVEKSHVFYAEGIRTMSLREDQLVSLRDSDNSAPKTVQEVNNRHALKLTLARAKCIAEIHRAEIEDRHANFEELIDQHVSGWPFECSMPGMKMLMIWEDKESRRRVSICPCIKELVRYCSGATSAASTPTSTSEPAAA